MIARPLARLGLCRSCHARGELHHPYCGLLRLRPCRGCGVELGHVTRKQYCEACWGEQCPECRRPAGRHSAACLFNDRRRRPGLTVRHDLVTEQEIEQLWSEHRWGAYDVARRIVGPTEAEDVVSEVFLTLLAKRAYLRRHPDVGYLLLATRHTAMRRHLYAWARLTVAMDPGTLVLAEQAMYKPHQPALAVPV